MSLKVKVGSATSKRASYFSSRRVHLFLLPIVLAVLFIMAVAYQSNSPEAFDYPLTDIKGRSFSVSDFRGKVVILDLMATWCPECLTQISHLKEVVSKYGDDRVVVMSVSIDPNYDSNAILQDYADKTGITWIVARDTANKLINQFQVKILPTTVIIDPQGEVQFVHEGVIRSEDLSQVIEGLLP